MRDTKCKEGGREEESEGKKKGITKELMKQDEGIEKKIRENIYRLPLQSTMLKHVFCFY